jgi:hypothetical protein
MTKTIRSESTKTEQLRTERWEDEGGKTLEIELPITAGRFVKPMPPTAGMQNIPRQWNRKLMIEPLQADAEPALKRKTP